MLLQSAKLIGDSGSKNGPRLFMFVKKLGC